MNILEIAPEFCSYALWELSEDKKILIDNIDVDTLLISDELKHDFRKWEDEYQAIYRSDDPVSSKFPSKEAKKLFWKTGSLLADRFRTELAGKYLIVFKPRI